MKTFIIASSEYEANWPDLFVMTEDGRYYGVSEHSYARFHKFPKEVDFWRKSEGSDAGRFFFVEVIDLSEEQVEKFEEMTKEYTRLYNERPVFGESYPERKEYKTKKEYNKAVDSHMERYMQWAKDSGAIRQSVERGEIWKDRVRLFLSFSKKVVKFLEDNENIQNL